MKMFKTRVLPVLLALATMLSLCAAAVVSSSAEGDNRITINTNDFTNIDPAHPDRFQAYQIFNGRVEQDDPQRLADADWGTGINAQAFVTAMTEEGGADNDNKENIDGTPFNQLVKAWLDKWNTATGDEGVQANPGLAADYTSQKQAAAIAAMLEEYGADNNLFMKTFARVAGKHLSATCTKSTYKEDTKQYIIDKLEPGYYLVKDTYVTDAENDIDDPEPDNRNDAVSEYIVDVLNDKTVDVKSSTPTLTKEVSHDGEFTYVGDEEIGDVITYRLTGTPAENYDMYKTYLYEFHDTLSEGLDFVKDAKLSGEQPFKVEAVNGEERTDITTYFTMKGAEGHDLEWDCADLKKIATVKFSTKLVLTYQARLNDKAKACDPEKNIAWAKYSNNPYGEGTGETPSSGTPEYTFGVEILKLEASEKKTPISGAGFKVKNESGQFATFTEVQEDGHKAYKLQGEQWNDLGTEIFTDTEGKLHIVGFNATEEGTTNYTLVETTAPVGYETTFDIPFGISVTYNEDGTVASQDIFIEKNAADDATSAPADRSDIVVGEIPATGEIPLTIFEALSPHLPKTGATTALVCTSIAVLCLAAAGVCFAVYRRNKRADNQ